MRLDLPFEPPWRVREAPDTRRVAIGSGAVITYGPIELAASLDIDVPPGAHVRVLRTTETTTRDRWPLKLVDAELVSRDGVLEARLYACYTFLVHVAVAVVRAADATVLDAQRAALLAILERGRPDWRGPPVCLADAWQLDRARLVDERVIDRFVVDGHPVIALETVRPRDAACYPVLAFRVLQGDGSALGAAVLVETSEPARAAGTPFVIGVVAGASYRVVATHATLPPYAQLVPQILPLLREAIGDM